MVLCLRFDLNKRKNRLQREYLCRPKPVCNLCQTLPLRNVERAVKCGRIDLILQKTRNLDNVTGQQGTLGNDEMVISTA